MSTTKTKALKIILVIFLLLGSAAGVWYYSNSRTSVTTVKVAEDDFTCPMHQQVHSDKPGDCPICGMKLVRRSTLKNTSADSSANSMGSGLMFSDLSAIRANVSTVIAEKKLMHNDLRLIGTIEIAEPNERMITARLRGRIEKLYIKETGDYISSGMPLYEFYSPELSSAVAQYITAKNQHNHLVSQHGNDEPHISIENLIREKLKLYELTDKQLAEYAAANKVPPTFTIYSPAAGTVMKKEIIEGAWVDEGTALFQIANLSTVWATLDIPEDMLATVHIGRQVSITSSAYSDQKFFGSVIFISPVVNPSTRTARIRVALTNPSQKLKIQMAVEGHLSLSSQKMVAVPASAIVHNGNEDIVWVKRSDGMFYPQKVILGYKDSDDYYSVVSGIDDGDEIAVSGTFLIDSERQLKMNSSPDNKTK